MADKGKWSECGTLSPRAAHAVHAAPCPRRACQGGFTLVELAVVLVILGLLVGFGASLAGWQLDMARRQATRERLADVERALALHVAATRRLPCPADATAGTGRERRAEDGSCRDDQRRGVVPWAALGLSERAARDGWERLLTYRVWDHPRFGLTRAGGLDMSGCDPAAPGAGAEENGRRAGLLARCAPDIPPAAFLRGKGLVVTDGAGRRVMDPQGEMPTGAAYVVISHGENGAGAYTARGSFTRIPRNPMEVPNRNDHPLDGARPARFEGFVDRPAAYAVTESDRYFDDFLLRPTILAVADRAHLGPRPHLGAASADQGRAE